MNTKTHTDIKLDSWVGRVLPARARPYALLARLDRPVGVWLLLLPGWWAIVSASGGFVSMGAREWGIFFLFGIGAVVMRGAGCVINDLWDRELDKKVERTRARPLASGTLNVRQAIVFLFCLLLIGLLVLLQMNFMTVLLGVLSLPLIAVYPLMKRVTWWPQAFLGLTFNFGALMGWSAVTGFVGVPAVFLYLGGIFWTLAYDTIYAHQDREDDALAGIKSTALKFGKNSKIWVGCFFAIALALIALASGGQGFLFLLPAAAHMAWQVKSWSLDDAASSLRVFKSNRDFGFLVMLGLAV